MKYAWADTQTQWFEQLPSPGDRGHRADLTQGQGHGHTRCLTEQLFRTSKLGITSGFGAQELLEGRANPAATVRSRILRPGRRKPSQWPGDHARCGAGTLCPRCHLQREGRGELVRIGGGGVAKNAAGTSEKRKWVPTLVGKFKTG